MDSGWLALISGVAKMDESKQHQMVDCDSEWSHLGICNCARHCAGTDSAALQATQYQAGRSNTTSPLHASAHKRSNTTPPLHASAHKP